jgi:anti-sigma regulatory factor (Ser/Thr protein kinase)
VLVEALANAIRHGNLDGSAPRDATAQQRARGVGLCARRDGEAMAFSIVQEGPGLASLAARLSAASAREDTTDPVEPGGLGLFLIARMSTRWAVDEDGRRLTIWL